MEVDKQKNVLWLDDDSPVASPRVIDKFKIYTAQTCAQAEKLISSGEFTLDWAIIDLIVPQGRWGGAFIEVPGVSYIRHLKARHGDSIGIAVYSIDLSPVLNENFEISLGVSATKTAVGFLALLKDIERISKRSN